MLSLHYNGANRYLFVNGTEIYKFKAKYSEIVASPLCLGKCQKIGQQITWKEQGLMDLFIGLTILLDFTNASSLNAISLSCISMSNQECKMRPQVVNVNGDEPVFSI